MTTNESELLLPAQIVEAISEHLQRQPQKSKTKQNIAEVYYDDEITFDQLKSLVGATRRRISAS